MTPMELWIAALESGQYKQGRNFLAPGDSYCCLGVACEVYQAHVGDLNICKSAGCTYYDEYSSLLPDKVWEWLGRPGRSRTGFSGDYAKLNDRGCSFSQIAEVLRNEHKQ